MSARRANVKSYKVILSPLAEADLEAIVDWIADQSSIQTARGFVGRIEQRIFSLRQFPVRGTQRDDLAAGVRILGVERRVTIVFRIDDKTVIVERVLYGGRDLERALPLKDA
jgi:toxin ParE1/3/4